MVSLETINVWSEKEQAVVEWTISLEEETDNLGNKSKAYIARHGEEFHKFSPNITDGEIEKITKEINLEHES